MGSYKEDIHNPVPGGPASSSDRLRSGGQGGWSNRSGGHGLEVRIASPPRSGRSGLRATGLMTRRSVLRSFLGHPSSVRGPRALNVKTCLCYSWRRRATMPLCGGGSAARRGGQASETHVSTEQASPEQDPRLSGENADPQRQERVATAPCQGPKSPRGSRAVLGRTASADPVG
jgi:hypothetical protein